MNGAQLLRAWRGERTLREAATDLGCDPSHISLLENGRRKKPGLDLAQRLLEKAGIPLSAWSSAAETPQKPKLAKSVTGVNGRARRASGAQ